MAEGTNYRFLTVATGFSAGVMLYISFVELFDEGAEILKEHYGAAAGNWMIAASFFEGMLLIGLCAREMAAEIPSRPAPMIATCFPS